jgi:hypothetical protein
MRNTTWLRVLFVLVFGQALLLGQAMVWPERIGETLPWPATPLNARFVAALYGMGAVTALLAVFAASYVAVRVSLVLVFVITGGLLLLTLPHLGEFTASTFPYRWVAAYTVDAIVFGVVLWRLRGRERAPAGRNPSGTVVAAYALVLTVVGAVMLVAPSFAVRLWPWGLTAILAQVYSVFFLTFALGGWLVARDPRPDAAWVYLTANLSTVLIVLGVSMAYPERFKAGPPTVIWYVLWGAGALALAVALAMTVLALRRTPTTTGVPA